MEKNKGMKKDENTEEVFDVLNGYNSLKHIEITDNDNTSALMRNFKVPGFSNNDSSQSQMLSHEKFKPKTGKNSFKRKKADVKNASKCVVLINRCVETENMMKKFTLAENSNIQEDDESNSDMYL